MNANFCQHLAVRELGRGGERGVDRRETGNGGFKQQRRAEKSHICCTHFLLMKSRKSRWEKAEQERKEVFQWNLEIKGKAVQSASLASLQTCSSSS